ncbi:MAG TPA: hypothetical protein VMZ30_22660, partial [Pyrinomonadaceae bacterium]|nr:hypothetical protein [Pyrinomonadaceae bacterium]
RRRDALRPCNHADDDLFHGVTRYDNWSFRQGYQLLPFKGEVYSYNVVDIKLRGGDDHGLTAGNI